MSQEHDTITINIAGRKPVTTRKSTLFDDLYLSIDTLPSHPDLEFRWHSYRPLKECVSRCDYPLGSPIDLGETTTLSYYMLGTGGYDIDTQEPVKPYGGTVEARGVVGVSHDHPAIESAVTLLMFACGIDFGEVVSRVAKHLQSKVVGQGGVPTVLTRFWALAEYHLLRVVLGGKECMTARELGVTNEHTAWREKAIASGARSMSYWSGSLAYLTTSAWAIADTPDVAMMYLRDVALFVPPARHNCDYRFLGQTNAQRAETVLSGTAHSGTVDENGLFVPSNSENDRGLWPVIYRDQATAYVATYRSVSMDNDDGRPAKRDPMRNLFTAYKWSAGSDYQSLTAHCVDWYYNVGWTREDDDLSALTMEYMLAQLRASGVFQNLGSQAACVFFSGVNKHTHDNTDQFSTTVLDKIENGLNHENEIVAQKAGYILAEIICTPIRGRVPTTVVHKNVQKLWANKEMYFNKDCPLPETIVMGTFRSALTRMGVKHEIFVDADRWVLALDKAVRLGWDFYIGHARKNAIGAGREHLLDPPTSEFYWRTWRTSARKSTRVSNNKPETFLTFEHGVKGNDVYADGAFTAGEIITMKSGACWMRVEDLAETCQFHGLDGETCDRQARTSNLCNSHCKQMRQYGFVWPLGNKAYKKKHTAQALRENMREFLINQYNYTGE